MADIPPASEYERHLAQAPASKQKYHHLYVDAGAWVKATTNGAETAIRETTTNKVCFDEFRYDGATSEFTWFKFILPATWNRGTVKFKVVWDAASAGSGTVVFALGGRAYNDGDTIDAAIGTEVMVVDTVQTPGLLHKTAATPEMTFAGTPAAECLLVVRVRRAVESNSGGLVDNMVQDAIPLGLLVQWYEGTDQIAAW